MSIVIQGGGGGPRDPEPHIRSLRVPIFAAFSLNDPVVPALGNAGLLRELGESVPGSDITVVTVEGANHRLELPAGRRADGRWYLPAIHPDFLVALENWVRWRCLAKNTAMSFA